MKVVIAGAGKFTHYLCQLLLSEGHSVSVIEKDQAEAQKIGSALGVPVIAGDATEAKTLELAGVENASAFVALTSSDEANMVSCLLAKELGAKIVAARAGKVEYDELEAQKLGIDLIIHPEAAAAGYIFELLKKPETLSGYLSLEKKFEIVEMVVGQNSSLVGKTFGTIEYPLGSAIIALQDRDNLITPKDDTLINVGMKLIIVAKEGVAEKIKKLLD